jgi:hypothetical protein
MLSRETLSPPTLNGQPMGHTPGAVLHVTPHNQTAVLDTTERPRTIRSGDMQSLIDAFPCLRRKGVRWKTGDMNDGSADFEAQISGMSSGEREAALFVLQVWNPYTKRHASRRFNVVEALNRWDEGNRAAFIAYCSDPWMA